MKILVTYIDGSTTLYADVIGFEVPANQRMHVDFGGLPWLMNGAKPDENVVCSTINWPRVLSITNLEPMR